MNYLAHFHLAGDDRNMLLGALLGDFVKGPLSAASPHPALQGLNEPAEVTQGIKLHRSIDAYVDQSPVLASLRERLPASSRRCQGILLDLFCDYALANCWQRYDERALEHYAEQTLKVLFAEQHALPEPARQLLQRMKRYQLLVSYGNWETIAAIADRIGLRLNMREPMKTGMQALWEDRQHGLEDFEQCYPGIVAHCNTMRAQLLCDNTR